MVHVIPVDDVVAHDRDAGCVCGPRLERVEPGGTVAIHHSMDGREVAERRTGHGIPGRKWLLVDEEGQP